MTKNRNDIDDVMAQDRKRKLQEMMAKDCKRWTADETVGETFRNSDMANLLGAVKEPVVTVDERAQIDIEAEGDLVSECGLFTYPTRSWNYTHHHCRQILTFDNTTSYVKSPKGSGKTHQLVDFIEELKRQGKSVLLIGHRRNLLASMSKRLDMEYYEDFVPDKPYVAGKKDEAEKRLMEMVHEKKVRDGRVKMRKSRCLAICLDSLEKLSVKGEMPEYDVVLIDESEQVIRHLSGETLKDDPSKNKINVRQKAVEALMPVLSGCSQLVMLDADLSELSFRVARRLRPDAYEEISVNQWKDTGRVIKVWADRAQMETEMLDAVQNGESVFYTCSNTDKCAELKSIIEGFAIAKSLTIISGGNSKTAKVKNYIQYLNDAKGNELNGHVVLATPALGTGTDITAPFDRVYGAFGAGYVTHFDMDQQIHRVRNPREVNIWISDMPRYEKTEPNAILNSYMRNYRLTCKALGESPNRDMDDWEDFYMFVNTMTVAMENDSKNAVLDNFVFLKESQGWLVDRVGKSKTRLSMIHPQLRKQTTMNTRRTY